MSISTLFQIEIPKRSTNCFHGNELFIPGMEIYSALEDSPEKDVYVRRDYCSDCWKSRVQQVSKETISTWKSKIPHKKPVSNLPLKRDERAMFLLKEALKEDNPDNFAETFVLAMYLARKRLIYYRQDLLLDDGRHVLIYETAQTEEMLCIKKIPLSSLNIEEIQHRLAAKMAIEHG